MGSTQETKAEVKNGIKRMVFAVLSILLEVMIILFLIFYAGQKAGWIYVFFRFVAVILVLAIFASAAGLRNSIILSDRSERAHLEDAQEIC